MSSCRKCVIFVPLSLRHVRTSSRVPSASPTPVSERDPTLPLQKQHQAATILPFALVLGGAAALTTSLPRQTNGLRLDPGCPLGTKLRHEGRQRRQRKPQGKYIRKRDRDGESSASGGSSWGRKFRHACVGQAGDASHLRLDIYWKTIEVKGGPGMRGLDCDKASPLMYRVG